MLDNIMTRDHGSNFKDILVVPHPFKVLNVIYY